MFKEATSYVESSLATALVFGIVTHHASNLKSLVKHQHIAGCLREITSDRGGVVSQALARIMEESHRNRCPLSTAVVVGDEGRPGQGFFNQARKLGYNVGETEAEENRFWDSQLLRMGISRRFIPNSLGRDGSVSELGAFREVVKESRKKERTLVTPDLDMGRYEKELQESKTKWVVDIPPDLSKYSHIYIPAGQLQVGDKVLLPKNPNGRRLTASEADLREVIVTRTQMSGDLIQWESSEGRTYRMPVLGVHVKIRARTDNGPKSGLPGDH